MLLTTEQTLTIPLIDISPFLAPDDAPDVTIARHATAELVDKACRDVGFFYVIGHGISEEECAGIRTVAKDFFELPENEKEEISISKSDFARGYQRLGQNITQSTKDWHEAIDLYAPIRDKSHPLLLKGIKTLTGENPVPRRPPNFSEVVYEYVDRMKIVGAAIMRAIGMGLGIGQHFFDEYLDDSFWVLRMIGYPPLEKQDGVGISCGEHTDYGCLTLLNTDSTPNALQVFSKTTQEWISPNPIPGAFIVNIGDMLNVWTNDIYCSTRHKVLHKGDTYRISVPFFYEPNWGARVEPIEKCMRESGGVAKHSSVVYGEHLLKKVLGNFDVGETKA